MKKMKKRVSLLLAVIMAVSITATACSSADSDTANTMPTLDSVTTTEATTTEAETTVTTTQTTAETEETTETAATSATVSSAAETTTAATWSETSMSATMYVTENCYSRVNAIVGSTPVSQYFVGDSVTVVAVTDTEYYKLDTGAFIHSDYLSDTPPVTTAATTEATTTATTADTAAAATTTASASSGGSSSNKSGDPILTPSYTVQSSSKYAYQQLNATEQQLYDDIVYAVRTLDQTVTVPSGMTSDDVYKVYTIVYNAEPELFWMGGTVSASSNFLTLSYKTTDRDEIASMQAEIDTAASAIISKANAYSGTYSKLKVIYDSIIKGAEFNMSEQGYNTSIYNGVCGGGLQCAGYAKTVEYLCGLAGIDCMVIIGTNSSSGSHAWNVVYCENGWYNLDATWGDPSNSYNSNYIQYEFFLVPDSWIHNITHYNVNTAFRSSGTAVKLFDPPSCTKESANYFTVNNKTYSTTEEAAAALYAEFDSAIASGSNIAEIRVTSSAIWDELLSDTYAVTFQKYCKSKSDSVSGLSRQTSNQSGVLVVHYDIKYN